VSEPKRKSEVSTNKGQPTEQEQQEKRELSEDERKEIREFLDRKRDRPRPPKARVKSAPRKPLNLDFPSAVEFTRFVSAFGTSEAAFANLMLSGILNGSSSHRFADVRPKRVKCGRSGDNHRRK